MNELGLPTYFGPQRRKYCKNRIKNSQNGPGSYFRIESDVERAFNKCYSFLSNQDHILPEPSTFYKDSRWTLEKFQILKMALNNTKSKLNDLNLKEWHLHTTSTNIAGDVMRRLRYSVNPEFLTQAWCKMYECLMAFWLVPKNVSNGVFNSVHLCEAPGAFITALNHFLQTWYPDVEWNWLATTLNPYHESNPLSQMIQDDRFILHTLDHWVFGEDGTGNIMDKNNLHHLQQVVNKRLQGNVMLVTADGSIDCQTNPAEQEALVAPLHYCETLTALSILQPGGTFMLKMFTLLECDSICLLYLLTCSFNSVNVFKPVKSKEGNSEIYVLCTEYIGRQQIQPCLTVLLDNYGPTISKAMLSEKDIPDEFKKQIYECAKLFTDLQIEVIERNLDLFFSPTEAKLSHCQLVKKRVADRYLQQYELQPVERHIVGNQILVNTPSFNVAQKYEEGTFNDRLHKENSDQPEDIEKLWASVQEVGCHWTFTEDIHWFMFNKWHIPSLELTFGHPISNVCSSKFCNGHILEAYNKVRCPSFPTSREIEVSTSVTVDVSELPWQTRSSLCHLQLLERVSLALQDLPDNKSLCIQGLPLFTQFVVAVVFLLAHSFFQIGLSTKGNVILCGHRQAVNSTDWVQSTLEVMHRLSDDRALLSLVPIKTLCDPSYCTKDGTSFYLSVSSINNARLLKSLEEEVLRVKRSSSVSL